MKIRLTKKKEKNIVIKKYYGTIREIGFWSNYNSGLVIPLSIDESLNNVNHKKCQEAVFCLNY